MKKSNNDKTPTVQRYAPRRNTETIYIGDFPGIIVNCWETLATKIEDDMSAQEGHIVSEVGPPRKHTLKSIGTFSAYTLREHPHKKQTLPLWTPGYLDMHEAFSSFNLISTTLGVVGEKKIINPVVTKLQQLLLSNYKTVRADAVYIITCPCPIGAAPYLRVSVPEIDKTSVPLSIRWKPSGLNTIAVRVCWSNDLKVVQQDKPRPGQSGLSITIEVMEDNSTTNVSTPLNISIYCCVFDIKCTVFKSLEIMDPVDVPALNFTPANE